MKSVRAPMWGYWGCVVGLLGCWQGLAGSDVTVESRDGDSPDDMGIPSEPSPSEDSTGGWQGALSVQGIEGEGFSQIWGTNEDLWVVGGPLARPAESSGPMPAIDTCEPNRFAADVIVRRNQGHGWVDMDVPARTTLTSLHGNAANNVWAVGFDGAAVQFDGTGWIEHDVRAASGLEFQEQGETCAELSLHSVFALSPRDVWAVGYIVPSSGGPGLILHFDGREWKRQPTDAADGFFDVWASSPSNAWAVGSSGLVYHFDGASWQRVEAKTSHYLFSVWGTSAADVWATGNTSVTTRFDGTEWTLLESEQPYTTRRGLTGSADVGPWALATTSNSDDSLQQALVLWDGMGWQEQASSASPATALNDLWVTPEGQLWGVGEKIIHLR